MPITKTNPILQVASSDSTVTVTQSGSVINLSVPASPAIKKMYYLFATQTGTAAPVPTILIDTVGTPVWSRTAAGTYRITKTGAFTSGKTTPDKIVTMYDDAGNKITIQRIDANYLEVKTYAAANTAVLADAVLSGHEIRIEIYL